MKKLIIILAIVITSAFLFSCKKTSTPSTSDIADSYVGVWNALDSSFTWNSDVTSYSYSGYFEQESFSIAKKDANNVNISNMLGIAGTTVWAVSENALSYVSGASGSNESFLSGLVCKKSGNKIYFLYTATQYPKRGVATKQ